jgi:hypothetical protein
MIKLKNQRHIKSIEALVLMKIFVKQHPKRVSLVHKHERSIACTEKVWDCWRFLQCPTFCTLDFIKTACCPIPTSNANLRNVYKGPGIIENLPSRTFRALDFFIKQRVVLYQHRAQTSGMYRKRPGIAEDSSNVRPSACLDFIKQRVVLYQHRVQNHGVQKSAGITEDFHKSVSSARLIFLKHACPIDNIECKHEQVHRRYRKGLVLLRKMQRRPSVR